MDQLPVPQGSWQAQYDAKQRKYNVTLLLGVAFTVATFVVVILIFSNMLAVSRGFTPAVMMIKDGSLCVHPEAISFFINSIQLFKCKKVNILSHV